MKKVISQSSRGQRYDRISHQHFRLGPRLIPIHFLDREGINTNNGRQRLTAHSFHAFCKINQAVKINVGHGVAQSSPSSSQGNSSPISPNQRKASHLELEQMKLVTHKILSTNSDSAIFDNTGISSKNTHSNANNNLDVFMNEIRVAYNYWVGRWITHFHPLVTPSPTNVLQRLYPSSTLSSENDQNQQQSNNLDESLFLDFGVKQAMKLLSWIIKMHHIYPQHRFIQKVFSIDDNAAFVNLIDALLLPCTTNFTNRNTNAHRGDPNSNHIPIISNTDSTIIQNNDHGQLHEQFVQFSSNTGLNNIQPSTWISCIVNACHIIDIMNHLHHHDEQQQQHMQHEDCFGLQPDVHSNNIILFTYSKLAILFGVLDQNSSGFNKSNYNKSNDINWNNVNSNDRSNYNSQNSNESIDWNLALDQLYVNIEIPVLVDASQQQQQQQSRSSSNHVPLSCQKLQSGTQLIRKMEDLLQQMEKKYFETNDDRFKPNVISYNHIIGALARSNTTANVKDTAVYRDDGIDSFKVGKTIQNASHRAEWYLKRMEKTEDLDLKKNRAHKSLDDDKHDYNYHVMEDNGEDNLPIATAYADSISYNLVIHGFSNTPSMKKNNIDRTLIERANQADKILHRMEERYNRLKRESSKPDTVSYSSVLHGYANAGKADKGETILNKMITLSKQSNGHSFAATDNATTISSIKPNRICFNTVIDAWAKTKGPKSAENAVAILNMMEDMSNSGSLTDLSPDTISYSSAIAAFARSGRHDAGDRAEELLQRSLKLYREGQDRLKPDSITFISVIDALAKQCHKAYIEAKENRAARKAGDHSVIEKRIQNLLSKMQEIHDSGDDHVRPCTVSYNILLDLYAKTSQADKAEQCLKFMNDSCRNGKKHMKPDIISYNAVLLALSQSSRKNDLEKAVNLLKSMEDGSLPTEISIKPDTVSYNTVMNGLAKSKQSGANRQVEEMILSMEERYKNGSSQAKPNIISYNIYIDAWSRSGDNDASNHVEEILEKMIHSRDVKPDTISFTSVINTFSKSADKDTPERAQKIFNSMQSLGVQQTRYTYNALINCWSRSGRNDAAERAEEILLNMTQLHDVSPDSVTFSSVIHSWAKSGKSGSGQRAERILDLMENIYKSGDRNVKPNKFTYGSVLNSWAKSGDDDSVENSLKLLHRMEEAYKNGNDDARPTVPSYNAVIHAFARSNSSTKASDCEMILNSMLESHHNGNIDAKPNLQTYATILNACAYTSPQYSTQQEKSNAFKIARKCFKAILSGAYGQPKSSIIFNTFILACSNLVPPGNKRDQLIASVFDECCNRGLVDTRTILTIRRVSSLSLKRELLDEARLINGFIKSDDIPVQWRSNVVEYT